MSFVPFLFSPWCRLSCRVSSFDGKFTRLRLLHTILTHHITSLAFPSFPPAFLPPAHAFFYNLGHGKTIRIASKSVRVPALIARALNRHPDVYQGMLLYSVAAPLFLLVSELQTLQHDFTTLTPANRRHAGIMCYSPREALFLYNILPSFGAACDDFLVAYPVHRAFALPTPCNCMHSASGLQLMQRYIPSSPTPLHRCLKKKTRKRRTSSALWGRILL